MADERTYITADYAHNEIHAATLALAAHYTVGDISYQYACQDRPCCEIDYMFQHIYILRLTSLTVYTACGAIGGFLKGYAVYRERHCAVFKQETWYADVAMCLCIVESTVIVTQ